MNLKITVTTTPSSPLRKMIDRLEDYYGFRCKDGGALRDCLEWQKVRDAALAREGKNHDS
jgi:hypothetical protein